MSDLTQARVRELLFLNRLTGEFLWRQSRGRNHAVIGRKAGTVKKRGYVYIKVDGRMYLAHRLAWLYEHGSWPPHDLDHVNGDPSDNRLSNLREATRSQNGWNSRKKPFNTSGYKGVSRHSQTGKWRAEITVGGTRYSLGLYENPEDAARAYAEAASTLQGDFARRD